jgi:5'-nucleotidase/UDP-sugar diphosphatase
MSAEERAGPPTGEPPAPDVRRAAARRAARRWLRLLGWTAVGVTVLALSARAGRAAPSATVRLSAPLMGEKARAGEAEIGNLVADAIRAATGADIALVAAGEIKDVDLPAGEVGVAQLVDALSYPQDPVVVLSLDGATIRKALELAVSLYPRKNKGFLQVSGLEFSFASGSGPSASGPIQARTAGAPLQDGKTYRVAMSSSLASGQYGYFRLWSRDRGASAGGLTLAAALQNYLRDRRQLNVRLEGRIVARGQ